MVQLVNTSACHAEDRGFEPVPGRHFYFGDFFKSKIKNIKGFIAQSVEQGTENPCVAGSIPAGATIFYILTRRV